MLTFDGGILRARSSISNFLSAAPGLYLTIEAGGAFIDSNGYDVRAIAGLSGTGSLTKFGTGTLSLAGDNSYSGGTIVENGVLEVDGGSISHALSEMKVGTVSGQTGTLSIGADSSVTSHLSRIGYGGTGVVNVGGTNARWSVTHHLLVGDTTQGELSIDAGGRMNVVDSVFIGNILGASGSLIVDGAGSRLDAGQIFVGGGGDGSMTLSNGGTVAVLGGIGTVMLGEGPLSTGTLNFGAYDLSAPTLAGTLNAGSIELFGYPGNGGAVNFNQTDHFTLSVPIEGNSLLSVNQRGSGTTTLLGAHTYGGNTTISDGLLVVNGSIANSHVALTGGTLGGSGTVGGVTAQSGSTVAPGNSIGMLTVTGDWRLNAGAAYEVEIKGGGDTPGTHNDVVDVLGGGTATFENGALIHVKPETPGEDGSSGYEAGKRYTVLVAAGGLTVNGDQTITDDFAYLDFIRDFDATNYYLVSGLATSAGDSFCLSGMSINQCATGNAAFGLGAGNDVYDAVLNLSNAQAGPGLDDLSGEGFATGLGQMSGNSIATGMHVLDRVEQAFAALGRAGALGYAPVPDDAEPNTGNAWAAPFSSHARYESNGNAAGFDAASGGLLLGGDLFYDEWLVGGFAGMGRTWTSIPDRETRLLSTDLSLGAYGGWNGDHIGLAFGTAWTHSLVSSTRDIAVGALNQTLTADYGADTLSAFAEINTTFDMGASAVTPYARLGMAHAMTQGFTETGGSAALTVVPTSHGVAVTELGIRAEHRIALDTTLATLSGGIGWRHGFGGTPTTSNSFAGGTPFTVAGNAPSSDALLLEAGLTLDFSESANLSLHYDGQFSSSGQRHAVGTTFGISF
ncbi:autotransporter domain-containing protein [Devosia sp. XK-2]|uniref:autotransporter outer membrane beta-barrel domain-containing protein n=1 Tax=Devosia sp. XK-2 TaxID=3126689 RepID=UPI0030CAF771